MRKPLSRGMTSQDPSFLPGSVLYSGRWACAASASTGGTHTSTTLRVTSNLARKAASRPSFLRLLSATGLCILEINQMISAIPDYSVMLNN